MSDDGEDLATHVEERHGLVKRAHDHHPGSGRQVGEPGDLGEVRHETDPFNTVCPHRGGPLANGRLDGHVVACPWHGWTFDVRTGRPDHPGEHGVAAYEVQVRRSDI